jgi:hypothetical protein
MRKIKNQCLCLLFVLSALLLTAIPVASQTASGTFEVVCVADRNAEEITNRKGCINTTTRRSFGDEVTLAVEHPPNTTFNDSTEPNPTDLVLFLDGKSLLGTSATKDLSQTDEDTGVTTTLLTYRIIRDLTNQTARKNWKEVLVAAQTGRRLSISTGLESGPAAASQAKIEFVALRTDRLIVWGISVIVGLFVFFLLAIKTGMLRDKRVSASGTALKATDRPYSLSRVQMAWWTVFTLYAYLYIWIMTGEYLEIIPLSIVGLMGISMVTLGSAVGIDSNPNKKVAKKGSYSFFKDIMTSKDGASLHRLQFLFWTLALTAVFVVTVWKTFAMPDFDATLLGLMGLASGTYVGLKIPEKDKS